MYMEYSEFISAVKSSLKEQLGGDYEVETKNILKNNSCIYRGIIIRKTSGSCNNIAPAIYMENWYEMYKTGESVDAIVKSIMDIYSNCCNYGAKIKLDGIKDNYDPGRIFYRLVNYEMNCDLLDDCPFIPFLDLAVTFHYLCSDVGKELHSFRITDDIMRQWGITTEYLFMEASRNMSQLFPDSLLPLGNVITELFGENDEDIERGRSLEDYDFDMYVLTNSIGIGGASAMLYTTKLQELAAELDSDLYVLPSSIHEVILISAGEGQSERWLKNLVKEVNSSIVSCEDRLSDNIYLFDRESGEMSVL